MRRIGCWIHKVFIPGAKNDKFHFLWYINIEIPDLFLNQSLYYPSGTYFDIYHQKSDKYFKNKYAVDPLLVDI